MQVTITVDAKQLHSTLGSLNKQVRFAASQAINDVAFKARAAVQREMDTKFDRVTPYIRRSVFVTESTPDTLVATVEPKYQGGKGIDPAKVLQAQVFGGSRRQKGSEKAMQSAGILPAGYSMVPGQQCPLDAYGNIKGSFLVQLISYFQAFGEQGYKANMTDRRKKNLAEVGTTASGYKTINGVIYFVAYGRLRGGRGAHLAPGIWSKTGIHGVDVKPIIMFVRKPNYSMRLDFNGVAEKEVNNTFQAAFATRFDRAMRTANP